MVLVGDPERADPAQRARFGDLYGLTEAEARTALAVTEAQGLRDLAERLGVRLSTVRTHLQHVFEKTGTHRQAELVRLLMAHRLPVLDDRPLVPPPACAAAAS
jgi:DNA-binding CsgD family transcriptional regulator